MPSEDPRVEQDWDDDRKRKKQDPGVEGEVDDPDAPAPFSGHYS